MRREILPELGSVRLSELRRGDLQAFADRLLVRGLSPSAVQVTLLPLRALFRRALAREELAINPCTGLHLPAVRGRRERYAAPEEAEDLIVTVGERIARPGRPRCTRDCGSVNCAPSESTTSISPEA
jgi:site-specific recombinase XerC